MRKGLIGPLVGILVAVIVAVAVVIPVTIAIITGTAFYSNVTAPYPTNYTYTSYSTTQTVAQLFPLLVAVLVLVGIAGYMTLSQ